MSSVKLGNICSLWTWCSQLHTWHRVSAPVDAWLAIEWVADTSIAIGCTRMPALIVLCFNYRCKNVINILPVVLHWEAAWYIERIWPWVSYLTSWVTGGKPLISQQRNLFTCELELILPASAGTSKWSQSRVVAQHWGLSGPLVRLWDTSPSPTLSSNLFMELGFSHCSLGMIAFCWSGGTFFFPVVCYLSAGVLFRLIESTSWTTVALKMIYFT